MQKLKLLMLSGILVLTLAGCGSETEPEYFEQGNISTFHGPVMETENAYYYTGNYMNYELYYYDKASGKSIFLCNKPECSHDGNEFCAATAGGRYVMYTRLYKDGIYIAALEPEENRIDKKLFKVSLDGTKMETIATYGYDPASDGIGMSYDEEKYMVLYDDKAIIPYETPQNDGWQTYGTAIVDLKSGKVQYLKECDSHKQLLGQEGYTPYGDYLYYYETNHYKSPVTLYRYHLIRKKTEEIPIAGGFNDFCIVDGLVVYSRADEDGFIHLYSMNPEDPEGQEPKDLTGPLKNEDGTPLLDEHEGTLLFDGEYLVTDSYLHKDANPYHYYMFSKDGLMLAEFVPPESIWQNTQPDFAILNGYVYFMDFYGTVRCPVQDILDGNPTWTTLYSAPIEEE